MTDDKAQKKNEVPKRAGLLTPVESEEAKKKRQDWEDSMDNWQQEFDKWN